MDTNSVVNAIFELLQETAGGGGTPLLTSTLVDNTNAVIDANTDVILVQNSDQDINILMPAPASRQGMITRLRVIGLGTVEIGGKLETFKVNVDFNGDYIPYNSGLDSATTTDIYDSYVSLNLFSDGAKYYAI